MAYCGYVCTINNIKKHPNADRLQIVTVFGLDTIVSMNYKEGDKCVYFPVDGQLSIEFATDNNLLRIKDENGNNTGGYMDPVRRNVTAVRLRGEKSEGLLLPIKCLEKYTDVETLKDGNKITVLNGHEICTKYIPNTNSREYRKSSNNGNGKGKGKNKEVLEKITYPTFVEHKDTAQLAFNQHAFKEGDTVYITLKMHGTSARTGNVSKVTTKKYPKLLRTLFKLKPKVKSEYSIISGTRRTILNDNKGGYYGSNAFREVYTEFFKDKLPKGVEVYYEIVGWVDENKTIMGQCNNSLIKDKEFSKLYGDKTTFSYGCEVGKNDIYVYRMTMTNEDGYMVEIPWEQVKIECEKLGVKTVPEFDKFIFTTWEDLMERVEKYYDGPDPVGKTHVREGVVCRIDNRESFTAYKHKNFSFKCLEGIIKDNSDAPDMEEAEELIEASDE